MNLNEALSIYLQQLGQYERPANQEDVDSLISAIGPFPSIETLEEVCKFYRDRRDTIERTDIPCTLAEYGVKRVTMEDGTEVSLGTFYETKQGDKEELASWVEGNGYADIIKDTLAFGKGEVDPELLSFLTDKKYSFSRDSSINSQTLKKIIKDHVAAGGELPPSTALSVTIFESAVVKRPKGGF
jgi:hypothetical protein